MEKTKLTKFIQKYNLNGNVNSVKWETKDDTLSTVFITPCKSLMGKVTVDNFNFESAEFGVYSTDVLQKLIDVLDEDITLDLKKIDNKAISLNVNTDTMASIDYQLSDLSVIGEAPKLKRIPEFETEICIDKRFIDTFIKGKSALSEVDSFTILAMSGKVIDVVIGYSSINSNRVNIPVKTTVNGLTENISFNADLFRDVLSANKECTSATLEISNDGLARIKFKIDDYDSVYYLVAKRGDE